MRQTSKSLRVCFSTPRQRPVGILAEILVAGRIEDVDPKSPIVEVHDRAADRDPALLLELEPIARRVFVGPTSPHRPGFAYRASEQQQLFGQRGLARVGMRNDRKGPTPLDLVTQATCTGFVPLVGVWLFGFHRLFFRSLGEELELAWFGGRIQVAKAGLGRAVYPQ